MAKKKEVSLKSTKASPEVKKIVTGDGLPEYKPFVIVQTTCSKKPLKLWLEENEESSRTVSEYILMNGRLAKRQPVRSERKVPKMMQQQLACGLIKWVEINTFTQSDLDALLNTTDKILKYCESINLKRFEDMTKDDLYRMSISIRFKSLTKLSRFLDCLWKGLNMNHLVGLSFISKKDKSTESNDDIDTVLESDEYSDEVMIQLIGYILFHINKISSRWSEYKKVNEEDLKKDGNLYYTLNASESAARNKVPNFFDHIKKIYRKDKQKAIDVFHKNMLLATKYYIEGRDEFYTSTTMAAALDHHSTDEYPLRQEYKSFLMGHYNMPEYSHIKYYKWFYERLNLNRFILETYLILQTGVNREVVTTLRSSYGGIHWTEMYDLSLGFDERTPKQRQVLRIYGVKNRGKFGKKKVFIRVPVESHLYKVLILCEEIFSDPGSKLFFSENKKYSTLKKEFMRNNDIYDKGKKLTTIESRKIRKTFAGVKLAKAINEAETCNDLTRKLRDALDHEEFDTTLFSYLLKTGVGNYVISHAIAALTTKMVMDCLEFKGEIIASDKSNRSTDTNSIPTYLCDCTDPTNPTHDFPISDRCTKHDLCLGCERSEVYAEHIPRICYRILQYDATPSPASDLIADRKAIALDTLERFRYEHPDGEQLLESSYKIANEAMLNNKPLLPAIF